MFCHGELVRLKPAPRWLTRFYLMISVGGAVGAVLVGMIAPLVLPAYFELGGGLVLTALLLLWQVRRDPPVYGVLALVAALAAGACAVWSVARVLRRHHRRVAQLLRRAAGQGVGQGASTTIARSSTAPSSTARSTRTPSLRREPTTYYTRSSGIGRLIESMHPRVEPLKVGVIGLGTGTLAVYGSKGDIYRFYDINPDVIDIARRDFTYLADSDATIETALWATRGCRSSASRRSGSTCWRSTRSPATRSRCTSSPPRRSRSTSGT